MTKLNKAIGFIRLIRPVNCVLMGVGVFVGSILAGSGVILQQILSITLGFLTGFMLTGSTMAINDYYDREIDAVNEPNRPIPTGLIKPSEALFFGLMLAALGFLTAAITNLQCLFLASLSWAIFVLYTTKGKKMGFIGNVMVSMCISIPFIYGSFVIERIFTPASCIFVVIVFLSNTGREIAKGIVDLKGDKSNEIQTIAVKFGETKAAAVSAGFYLTAISLTPLPWFLGLVSFWFVPLAIITDIGLASVAIVLLSRPSRETVRKIKNQNLFWFFIGLLAFMAGTIP